MAPHGTVRFLGKFYLLKKISDTTWVYYTYVLTEIKRNSQSVTKFYPSLCVTIMTRTEKIFFSGRSGIEHHNFVLWNVKKSECNIFWARKVFRLIQNCLCRSWIWNNLNQLSTCLTEAKLAARDGQKEQSCCRTRKLWWSTFPFYAIGLMLLMQRTFYLYFAGLEIFHWSGWDHLSLRTE